MASQPFIPVIPIEFSKWMANVPYSFILMASLQTIHSFITSSSVANITVEILGGFTTFYFVVAYYLDYVIPQIRNWNTLTPTQKIRNVSSWSVIALFIIIFVYRGLLTSSKDIFIHACIAFTFASLFHLSDESSP